MTFILREGILLLIIDLDIRKAKVERILSTGFSLIWGPNTQRLVLYFNDHI